MVAMEAKLLAVTSWQFGSYPLVMTNSLLLKMAMEIVDFPIKNDDFP